jgi:TonB family protein
MTLRKAILLSWAAHLFLFGTSLVFARYSGGLLSGPREPILVTLVGRGGNEASAKPDGDQRQRRLKPRFAQERSLSVPEQTESRSPIPETASAVTGGAGETPSGGADHVADDSTGHSAEGQAGGAEFGLVSAEQWAQIVSSIERVKNYPRFARERGIEGVVHVRFRLRPQGDVERVEIVKSSGSGVLDESSVRTVYRAAPMPYVNGWVEVPIAYVLK